MCILKCMNTFNDLYHSMTVKDRKSLADSIGVPYTTVYRWATGRSMPSVITALKIRSLTGVSIESWDHMTWKTKGKVKTKRPHLNMNA